MREVALPLVKRAVILALVAGVVVTAVGLYLGWNTYRRFSDGYFWVGAILIAIGFISVMGAMNQQTVSGMQYSETAVHMDAGERYKFWAADMLHNYHIMAFLGLAGTLLLLVAGLAVLIGRAL
jgi:hypothetical protein